jgi:plastocyanin
MLLIFAFSALLPIAFAQYNNPAGSSSSAAVVASSTKQASAATHTVTVGQGGNLKFSPESLSVAIGSTVVFEFYPGSHSVIQGSFDKPCSPASGLSWYSGVINSNSGPAVSKFSYWDRSTTFKQTTNDLRSAYSLKSSVSRLITRIQSGSTAAQPPIAKAAWWV